MIPRDIIKAINETFLDWLVNSNDTNHEARIDYMATLEIVMTAHAQIAVLALEIDVHVETTNIRVLTHPYTECHVLDEATHSIQLQIANVLHHLNRSRRT